MVKFIQKIFPAIMLILFLAPTSAYAVDVFQNCSSGSGGGSQICGAAQQDSLQNILKNIINTILYILGIIAVIMIVIGGIRYTTSNGDSAQVQSAKNTVLYSVIGLVVGIMAYAIVNFVLGALQ